MRIVVEMLVVMKGLACGCELMGVWGGRGSRWGWLWW